MKKILLLFFCLFISIDISAIEINSKNAILYNLNDNSVIYEKNSNEIVPIASLTKIITAITIIENEENLDKKIKITNEMLRGLDGYAKANFKVGDELTYLDLLYALMLPSAADAAQALAISHSGSIEKFVILMNNEIKKIGVYDTKLDNPIGKDSENNYSTASDLSKILMYCLKNKIFYKIFNTNTYKIESLNKNVDKTISKIGSQYNLDTSIIKGGKTGFTYDAGLCLASTSTIEDVNYLLITLGGDIETPNHIKDAISIYKYYSENYGYIKILNKNQLLTTIKVKESKIKEYNIYSDKEIDMYLSKSIIKDNLNYEYEGIDELNREIKKGDKLGKIDVMYNNEILYTYDVYLNAEIEYYNYTLYISFIIILLLTSLLIIIKRKK